MESTLNPRPFAEDEWPIFLDYIRPGNGQRGGPGYRGKVESCKASLKIHGQLNPILIRPLAPGEIKDDSPHQYEIVDGHVRFQSALELGWDCLKSMIQDRDAPAPVAYPEAPVENRVPEEYQIPATALAALAGLLQSRPEDEGWAGRIMLLVLRRKMTEAQIRGLVEWVRQGKDPGGYGDQEARPDNRPPVEDRTSRPVFFPKPLPRNVLTVETPEGYEFILALPYGGFAESSGENSLRRWG